jgi:hypothetical protein
MVSLEESGTVQEINLQIETLPTKRIKSNELSKANQNLFFVKMLLIRPSTKHRGNEINQ